MSAAQPRIVSASGDDVEACAIVEPGRVHCWQRSAMFWVPGITDARSLSVARPGGCAIRDAGVVSCWYSQDPGRGKIRVEHLTLDAPSRLAKSSGRACAIVSGGRLSCWKTDGYPEARMKPAAIPHLTDTVDVSVYDQDILALLRDGTLLAVAGTTPPNGPVSDAAQITLGDHFACAATRAGTASCWGNNWMGRLGDGTLDSRDRPRPVVGLADVVETAAGVRHACARHGDGSVSCWGSNEYGQLGVASTGPSDARPVAVRVPGVRAVALTAANHGTCAVTVDRQLMCWGGHHGPRRREISAATPP